MGCSVSLSVDPFGEGEAKIPEEDGVSLIGRLEVLEVLVFVREGDG